VSKALATGWAGDFRWKDVEVMNDPSGQPRVTLHGRLREKLASAAILLSLSHSDHHVVAMALIEEHR
jgi:holo-[acyl-carrier protein] synthase